MLRNLLVKSLLTVSFTVLITLLGGVQPITAIAAPPVPLLALFSFSGSQPSNLGIQQGQFAACASTPNCVSSQAQDAAHHIDPIAYQGEAEVAFAALKQAVQEQPRTAIVNATDDYLYAQFTSKLMGFVDDVELYLNRSAGVIEVRSASRLGESDLGVNRQRIETLRAMLDKLG
jgi:uncharacterized protein (DUF1499 family)